MAIGGFIFDDLMRGNQMMPNAFGSMREGLDAVEKFKARRRLARAQTARERAGILEELGDTASAQKELDREAAERRGPARDPIELMYEKEMLKDRIERMKKDRALGASEAGLRSLLARNKSAARDFDEDFVKKNGDEVDEDETLEGYKGSRNWSRGALWDSGATAEERAARQTFATLKEQQVNEIYQTLKGSGAITEGELDKQAGSALNARNPYELKIAIEAMLNHVRAKRRYLAGLGGFAGPGGSGEPDEGGDPYAKYGG